MSVEHVFPSWTQFEHIDQNIARIAENLSGKQTGSVFPEALNESNYIPTMRKWFHENWRNGMSDYTELCDKWYEITRTGWIGGTKFSLTSSVSTGEKVGDNAGMKCTPSTSLVKNQDDYASVPLFYTVDCNVELDSAGKPRVTAIANVAGDFRRSDPTKIVCAMQMTGWIKYEEDLESYTYLYTDIHPLDGYQPLPEAVALDGSIRSWVVHCKYAFGDDWQCCSGQKTRLYDVSHNSQLDGVRSKWGTRYCGRTSADDAFVKLMVYLKYASLTTDTFMIGCLNYNYQYAVAEQEEAVERVILTSAQAANLLVGSSVIIGNPTAFSSGTSLNIDRGQAGMRAKANRVKITKKETLVSGNVAVYVDNGGLLFNTTASTISSEGDSTTYISTIAWETGSTDDVLGFDGSIYSNTSGKEPYKVQGIENIVGAYFVYADTILQYFKDESSGQHLRAMVCRDATKFSKSVTSDYKSPNYNLKYALASNSWQYQKRIGHDDDFPELMFPSEIGGSSSTYTRDGIYLLANSTASREWLAFGGLTHGVGTGGLSYVNADHSLSGASWSISGGLSVNGNRGEYAA